MYIEYKIDWKGSSLEHVTNSKILKDFKRFLEMALIIYYTGRQNFYPKTGIGDHKGFRCPENETVVQIFLIRQEFEIS